jgi:hypothetical protein
MVSSDRTTRSSRPDLFRPSTSFACSEFETRMPATQARQRVRPEVAGPMTSSATPFFERLCAGMTIQSNLVRL